MSDTFDLDDDFEPPFPNVGGPMPAASPQNTPYLEGLNPEQRAAVEATEGPVLVLAGAGTGKTRVLTTRLAHIVATRKAWPSQILTVTFTNKAAREMKDRAEAALGQAMDGMWLGTFHSMCAKLLRRHSEVVGLRSDFTILDTDDVIRLIKQLMPDLGIDDKKFPPRAIAGMIDRWKDRGLTPDKVTMAEGADGADGKAVTLYQRYQDRLRILNACDFGDLILHCITVFQKQPDILTQYQQKFRYILVDEYQDTNVAQYMWLRLLAQKNAQGMQNICCVGDDDQSIYGWRGAEVGNILRFERDFPGATVVRLERNYRSTGHILAAASGLINHNAGRLGKTLWTEDDTGERLTIQGVWDGDEEARWIGEHIEDFQRKGTPLKQMAILVRAGFQTRVFEERFLQLGIPYMVIGGPRFYERQEIRDALAYLRVVQQPDDDLAFERIINKPKRKIGAKTLNVLHTFARAQGISLYSAATKLCDTDEITKSARTPLKTLLQQFEVWRHKATNTAPGDLTDTLLTESGYVDMWRAERTPDAPGRIESLKELVLALDEFETLAAFLEHVSLVMDTQADAGQDSVTVMTLHAAKGLEFDTIFLPGWEEGLFPHQRALDQTGLSGLEEERRLAYVGITRARKKAFISFAGSRRIHGQWTSSIPSRFIEELPTEAISVHTAQGQVAQEMAVRASAAEDSGFSLSAPSTYGQQKRKRGPASVGFKQVSDGQNFQVGDRVFHQKFGYGEVMVIEGDKLAIEFDKAGSKMVMATFVEPA